MVKPDNTIMTSIIKIARTISQPNNLLNIMAIRLVPPIELPVLKISPQPTPIKKPAKTAETSGSPSDSTLSSDIKIKKETIGTFNTESTIARFVKNLKPAIKITEVRINVTIPGDQPNA